MILQALCELYDNRKQVRSLLDDPKGMPSLHLSIENISFALVIDRKGKMLDIVDLRKVDKKGRLHPIDMIVPESVIGRAGRVVIANFLWDNTGYFFGADDKSNPERSRDKFEAFRTTHVQVAAHCPNSVSMRAVVSFLDGWNQKLADKTLGKAIADRIEEKDFYAGNIVFMVRTGAHGTFVHDDREVYEGWVKYKSSIKSTEGWCLLSGAMLPISRLHHLIGGVSGAQSTGAAIVSFNLDAFESYGKSQNYNSPISELAAFKYTTALNRLLMRSFGQRLQIGDATTVFWTERSSPIEDFMGNILDRRADASVDAADAKKIGDYLVSVRKGTRPELAQDETMRFYILGLAPNASRLAVRFWYVDTVEIVNQHIGRHFADIEIVKEFNDQPSFPGLWQLLIETALLRKSDNINPTLAGALFRSILQGALYPTSLLSTVVERVRADHEINYLRAAIIKGVLTRNYKNKEATVALNEDSTSIAYRLGRLFAVLEKAQEEAIPGANATIKDRFFGSASATPSVVFPQLIRLSQHHLAKLDPGPKIHKEQLIQSILDGIDAAKGLPAHLRLEDQGMFALGYYHQRKAFFTKKEDKQTVA
jgi:CRISPR-associated protein Csd1